MKIKIEEILSSLKSSTASKIYKDFTKYNTQRSEKNIVLIQVENIVSEFANVSVLINGMKALIAMVSKNVK